MVYFHIYLFLALLNPCQIINRDRYNSFFQEIYIFDFLFVTTQILLILFRNLFIKNPTSAAAAPRVLWKSTIQSGRRRARPPSGNLFATRCTSSGRDAAPTARCSLTQWRCCYSPCISRASRPRPRSHSVPAGVGHTTEPLPSSFSHLYRDRGHSSQPFQLGLATQVSTS